MIAWLAFWGIVILIALFAWATKVEMDSDFKEYDRNMMIKHIERMDKGAK